MGWIIFYKIYLPSICGGCLECNLKYNSMIFHRE